MRITKIFRKLLKLVAIINCLFFITILIYGGILLKNHVNVKKLDTPLFSTFIVAAIFLGFFKLVEFINYKNN